MDQALCFLSVLGHEKDNANANDNNITFIIKDTTLCDLAVILSAKNNKELLNFLSK